MRILSLDHLPPAMREQAARQLGQRKGAAPSLADTSGSATGKRARRGKYDAKPSVIDGIRFHSTKEGKRYGQLCALRKAGVVKWFHRQPIFDLPGGTTYRGDFHIGWDDGRITYEDVKGMETSEFKLKRKQVRALYGVEIEVI